MNENTSVILNLEMFSDPRWFIAAPQEDKYQSTFGNWTVPA